MFLRSEFSSSDQITKFLNKMNIKDEKFKDEKFSVSLERVIKLGENDFQKEIFLIYGVIKGENIDTILCEVNEKIKMLRELFKQLNEIKDETGLTIFISSVINKDKNYILDSKYLPYLTHRFADLRFTNSLWFNVTGTVLRIMSNNLDDQNEIFNAINLHNQLKTLIFDRGNKLEIEYPKEKVSLTLKKVLIKHKLLNKYVLKEIETCNTLIGKRLLRISERWPDRIIPIHKKRWLDRFIEVDNIINSVTMNDLLKFDELEKFAKKNLQKKSFFSLSQKLSPIEKSFTIC